MPIKKSVKNIPENIEPIANKNKGKVITLGDSLTFNNIVFGCDEEILGHKWWFEFDDENQVLLYTKKMDAIEKFLSVGQVWKFQKYYEDSFILQFYWKDNIDLKEREPFKVEKKITFLSLVKKYFSKKARMFLSAIKK